MKMQNTLRQGEVMVVRSKNKKSKLLAKNREKLERMAREQGVTKTSNLENLEGKGKELWDSDEEFEQFLEHMKAIRKEKG